MGLNFLEGLLQNLMLKRDNCCHNPRIKVNVVVDLLSHRNTEFADHMRDVRKGQFLIQGSEKSLVKIFAKVS